MLITNLCNKTIEFSFYLLLFLTPFILTPLNYELFEYNKMMFVYVLTIVAIGAWVAKMIAQKRFRIQRTPLDIPIFLFFISQVISFLVSIDRHVSLWGYYSRFHGGLLSTVSYLLLYYAFVSNLDKEKAIKGLKIALLSGFLVAAYGVAEHFGIDAKFWVQDVKNRVFSSLGQPNWLATYLAILIPLALAFGLQNLPSLTISHGKNRELGIKNGGDKKNLLSLLCIILASLFYLTLLYTKSRSGFLGFWVGNLIFWGILFLKFQKRILKWFIILNSAFLIINFIAGSPFDQINRYTSLAGLREKFTHVAPPPSSPPPPGGTESGEIRRIVWKGALEVWRHYPVFGSGVETFAFSYYQYRPVEHNMVSEWDFLYNKAHNEYLNFLATTGAFGLGAYLLVIFWFMFIAFKYLILNISDLKSKAKNNSLTPDHNYYLILALLSSYFSILVSNFFGFSVVVVAVFFFLIPTFFFILSGSLDPEKSWSLDFGKDLPKSHRTIASVDQSLSSAQWISIFTVLLSGVYLLYVVSRLWTADYYFAKGYNLDRLEMYQDAYPSLKQAVKINSSEPFYHDELSSTTALLAIDAARDKNASQAAYLVKEAVEESQKALETSPNNVNFWKTRTKVFYTLSALNEEYNQEALEAIKKARDLAPTDPKIAYNLAILYGRTGDKEMAIKTLEETIKLKPDYRDAHYALALYLKAKRTK